MVVAASEAGVVQMDPADVVERGRLGPGQIILVDTRVEKLFPVAKGRTLSVFVDGYNLTNTNAAANINWVSGRTFLNPTTIVPPRLFRFGAKLDW